MAQTETASSTADKSNKDNKSNNNDAALWVTYINIVLYALCFQLQRPVEPFLIKSLAEQGDASDAEAVNKTYGQLQAFFSAIQTIGSPLVGILLDRVGIRYASAMVFLSSALSYGILAGASDLNLLFLSKVPTALQHAFLVAQATAATSTGGDASARAAALGRMTTAYTIGATLGPLIGGFLADHGDFYVSAKLAVFGSLVSVLLSLLYLPGATNNNGNNNNDGDNSKSQSTTTNNKESESFWKAIQHSIEIASRPHLWPLLVVKVLGGMTSSMQSTAMTLILTQTLGFHPSELGINMSTSMFSVAFIGAFAMGALVKSLGPPGMAKTGLSTRALLGFLVAILISSASTKSNSLLIQIVIITVLNSLASHVLATGLTTQTTGVVDKEEQGALLGLEHGLFSLARIGGPPLGTTLLGSGGLLTVQAVCGGLDILLVILIATKVSATTTKSKEKSKGQ